MNDKILKSTQAVSNQENDFTTQQAGEQITSG